MGNRYGVYTNSLIEREVEEFTADVDGVVEMLLVETTTMSEDSDETIYYELTALNGIYRRLFTVPKGTIDANFFDLPTHVPS